MPVPHASPDKWPVTMCEITGCPYIRRCKRGGYEDICQQHQRMWDKHGRFDYPLNLDSLEVKYTLDGYPAPH